MPAYFVAEVEVTNPAGYEPYRALAGARLAQNWGRGFTDAAAAKRWYNSPEYQRALPIRLANSTGRAFIVEGA